MSVIIYGEIWRSYTERICHVYGRVRRRIRSFTTVYGSHVIKIAKKSPILSQFLGPINREIISRLISNNFCNRINLNKREKYSIIKHILTNNS